MGVGAGALATPHMKDWPAKAAFSASTEMLRDRQIQGRGVVLAWKIQTE